ncbi:MAG: spore photoproduct lyase family protein [Armatimonadota bacterium]
MEPLKAERILIVEGVMDEARTAARAERMIEALNPDSIEHVDDARLCEIMEDPEIVGGGRHGMYAEIDPVVIFNRERLDETEEEREARIDANPCLKRGGYPLGGYDSFHWRHTGTAKHRAETGWVCTPAWQLHTIWGCHYRCSYCSLGHYVNILMNMEQFVEALPDLIAEHAPNQGLFQYDNGTDTVSFEPEYGGAKLMIDFFAGREDQFLELYVGKSANVDFLLDYDHRGHTVCCWSLSSRTQASEFEWRSAPMEERIEAARRCEEAGYHVRHRFSPIIPVRNWREEITEMIELLFANCNPDVITFETLRFMKLEQIEEAFDVELLDPEFVEVMKTDDREDFPRGDEIPDEFRHRIYRHIFDELERVSPETPYAFCREQRSTWECFAEDFDRHNQHPDRYVCNCGAYSQPGHELLRTTQAIG